jgi:hypothetical protein
MELYNVLALKLKRERERERERREKSLQTRIKWRAKQQAWRSGDEKKGT